MVKKNTKREHPKNTSKRMFAISQEIKQEEYKIEEAIELLKKLSKVKFNESLEVALNLNVDPKQSDQAIRAAVTLPAGTGKNIKVAAFVSEDNAGTAKKAGADIIVDDKAFEEIKKGTINFDKTFATPDMMPKLGQVAKILGPRGLMPNPKLGNVSSDIDGAIKEIKAGQVELRTEKNGVIHAPFGKINFDTKKLLDNFNKILNYVSSNKPKSVKGKIIESVYVSSTMGKSLKLDLKEAS